MISLFINIPVFALDNARVYSEDKPTVIVVSEQPEFVIKLKSNPSTGFSWFLSHYDENLIVPVGQSFQPPVSTQAMGAPGYELWRFKVKPTGFVVPQQTTLQFVYIRGWDAADQEKPLEFKVNISARSNTTIFPASEPKN